MDLLRNEKISGYLQGNRIDSAVQRLRYDSHKYLIRKWGFGKMKDRCSRLKKLLVFYLNTPLKYFFQAIFFKSWNLFFTL